MGGWLVVGLFVGERWVEVCEWAMLLPGCIVPFTDSLLFL